MRPRFVYAALFIGVLAAAPSGTARAMATVGYIESGAMPSWIAIAEPVPAALPAFDPLLPPQIERVLMLDLNSQSAEAAIDALFSTPAVAGDRGWLESAPPLHPGPLGTVALMLVAAGAAGYRLGRRRRAWRHPGGAPRS